jgi:sterol desaturase/sphingolipid hydroxylase (fatty acid hydroxylase superfamily)
MFMSFNISLDLLADNMIYFLIAGEDHYTQCFYVFVIYAFLLNWIVGLLFLSFDVTLKPSFIRKYKIQPATNEPVDIKKLPRVILQVLSNQLIIAPLVAQVGLVLMKYRGLRNMRQLPTISEVATDLAVSYLLWEFVFYYSHRLLHMKYFYKRVHKIHHEWTSPIAITSQYCHPLEHVLSNLVPVFVGPMIMNSHLITLYIWTTWVILESLKNHCGYHISVLPSCEMHDYHHLK